jgi:hypothetical protein
MGHYQLGATVLPQLRLAGETGRYQLSVTVLPQCLWPSLAQVTVTVWTSLPVPLKHKAWLSLSLRAQAEAGFPNFRLARGKPELESLRT